MRGPFQRLMFFGRTLMAVWLLLGIGSSLLFAEDDRFTDLGSGQWIQEFRLPDAYLPAGFRRDPTNRHWIIKPMDPAGVGKSHTHQYGIMSTAYVSNKRLSAKPGDVDCPMGYGPDNKPFIQRIFGGVLGFWKQVYETPSAFQFNFIFEIGSCVVAMYFDVREATPVRGNTRYPRPTQQEIQNVVGQFVDAYRRYVTDKGWTNLKGKPPTVLKEQPKTGDVPPGGKDSVSEGSAGDDQKGTVDDGDQRQTTPVTPGEAAAGAGVVGAIAAVGAWLTMLSSGVRPKDVMDALGGLFGTGSPPEPVAEPPVEPPIAEPPRILFQEPPHKDGEVNEIGEVWSNEDRGWVGRNLYEQEKARRTDIDRINQEALQTPDASVKQAYDQWQDSKKKLDEMREARIREHKLDALRLDLEQRQRDSDRGVSWTETISDNLEKDWKELKEDCGKLYDAATDGATYEKLYNGAQGLGGKVMDKAWKAAKHPWDTTVKVFEKTGEAAGKIAAAVYDKPELVFIAGGKMIEAGLVHPLKAVIDPHKRLSDRLLAVGKLELDYALIPAATTKIAGVVGTVGGRVLETVGQAGGKVTKVVSEAGEKVMQNLKKLGFGGKVVEEGAEKIGAKGLNPTLSAMEKKLAFLESSETLAKKAKMMQKLNDVADAPEGMRMWMLNEVRKEDPAVFNLVRNELHPETAKKIGGALTEFNQDVLGKTAQTLQKNGYLVEEVKVAGKVNGADCDSYWKVVKDGQVLSESETRKLVDTAREGVLKDEFGHLRSTADDLGHKTMNGSPEKFAANPKDMGIQEMTVKPKADGGLDFDKAVKAGPDPKQPRGLRQADLLSDSVKSKEVVDSVEKVLKTKTDHIRSLGRPATPNELGDLAREIHKTGIRTVDALAEKTTAPLTSEYQALRRQMALVAAGDPKGGLLPTLDKIDRILADQMQQIRNVVPK